MKRRCRFILFFLLLVLISISTSCQKKESSNYKSLQIGGTLISAELETKKWSLRNFKNSTGIKIENLWIRTEDEKIKISSVYCGKNHVFSGPSSSEVFVSCSCKKDKFFPEIRIETKSPIQSLRIVPVIKRDNRYFVSASVVDLSGLGGTVLSVKPYGKKEIAIHLINQTGFPLDEFIVQSKEKMIYLGNSLNSRDVSSSEGSEKLKLSLGADVELPDGKSVILFIRFEEPPKKSFSLVVGANYEGFLIVNTPTPEMIIEEEVFEEEVVVEEEPD